MKEKCPLHNVELIETKLPNGKSDWYCPKCEEIFGEKI
jgi:hypothetical protein